VSEVEIWICDVHGVLIESTVLLHDAFVATTAHYDIPFTEHDYRIVKGLPLIEAYRRLDQAGEPLVPRRFHLRYLRDRIAEVRAYSGVLEVLSAAKASGVRIGATSSVGEIAEACLVNTGLYSCIDCLITQEEVKRPKPHPDSLLAVLGLLACATGGPMAGRALCIGDTALDVEAGRAAGVRTIGVTYGVSDEAEITSAGPDHVIHSFDEMRRFLPAEVAAAGPDETVVAGTHSRAHAASIRMGEKPYVARVGHAARIGCDAGSER
jgi:pyrophosphatase PpaX